MQQETNLYSIYDMAAEKYAPIFEAINNQVAIRQFKNVMERVPNNSKNDFVLYLLGSFNYDTGVIVSNIAIIPVFFEKKGEK